MNYLFAGSTDVGINKSTNQDSYCMMEALTPEGKVMMAVVCDGMGGLEKGELASKTIINKFEAWFEYDFPKLLSKDNLQSEVRYQWDRLIKTLNANIGDYGKANYINLGSTVTALFILPDLKYVIGHVGDTRTYRIKEDSICIITEDQTLVAREVKMGRLTPEQAAIDPRRNVLLQCVGASKTIEPDFVFGQAHINEEYMLCSDGFRHKVDQNEMHMILKPSYCKNESEMKSRLDGLIDMNKERKESDNITAIMLKIVE